jgi:hypothetical protein
MRMLARPNLLQEYEAKIAALERMVGRQALEIEFLSRNGLGDSRTPVQRQNLARQLRQEQG